MAGTTSSSWTWARNGSNFRFGTRAGVMSDTEGGASCGAGGGAGTSSEACFRAGTGASRGQMFSNMTAIPRAFPKTENAPLPSREAPAQGSKKPSRKPSQTVDSVHVSNKFFSSVPYLLITEHHM